jgi:hypothetical protein
MIERGPRAAELRDNHPYNEHLIRMDYPLVSIHVLYSSMEFSWSVLHGFKPKAPYGICSKGFHL